MNTFYLGISFMKLLKNILEIIYFYLRFFNINSLPLKLYKGKGLYKRT